MEIVNEGEVPGICGVDLVVGGHLHPLLKVGEDGDTLHRSDTSAAHVKDLIVFDLAAPRRPGVGRRRGILRVLQSATSLSRRGRRGGFDFVDLLLVQGLSRVQTASLLLLVVV